MKKLPGINVQNVVRIVDDKGTVLSQDANPFNHIFKASQTLATTTPS